MSSPELALSRAALRQRRKERAARPNSRQDVVFVGLSPSGQTEGPRLNSQIPSRVISVVPARRAPHLLPGLTTRTQFDVTNRPGAADFASALGLAPDSRRTLTRLLGDRRTHHPASLATLARSWAAIDQAGGELPARMILSGHSIGEPEIGGDRGLLRADHLEELAGCFPDVAKAVRHLHLSACRTAPPQTRWTTALPAVETVWGYDGFCPSTDNGASLHQRRWEEVTRAPEVTELSTEVLSDLAASGNVRLWSL